MPRILGKDCYETTDAILAENDPEAKVACIGPAGENLVLFACVMNDKHRAAGRTGGAVMGSKNLKAIAVRGTGGVKIADREAFLEALRKARKNSGASCFWWGLPTYGTNVLVNVINSVGALPTRNFKEAWFEGADKISGETMASTILLRNKACASCASACGRVTRLWERLAKGLSTKQSGLMVHNVAWTT